VNVHNRAFLKIENIFKLVIDRILNCDMFNIGMLNLQRSDKLKES